MKYYRKLLATVLSTLLLAGGLSGCNNTSTQSSLKETALVTPALEETDTDLEQDGSSAESESEEDNDMKIEIAGEITDSGSCGDNAIWQLYEDGSLVISGTGEIYRNAFADDSVLVDDNSVITKVVIEDGITGVGIAAFMGCESIVQIRIGKDVVFIDYGAFMGCSALKEIEMPKTMEYIGGSAFYDCYQLENIILPSGITEICKETFARCRSLQTIGIPNGVTYIGTSAFDHCEALLYIEIPDGVHTIGESAFEGCYALEYVKLPSSVTTIGEWVFYTASATFGKYNNLSDIYYAGSESEWNEIICGYEYHETAGTYYERDDYINVYEKGASIGDTDNWERELFYLLEYGTASIHFNYTD